MSHPFKAEAQPVPAESIWHEIFDIRCRIKRGEIPSVKEGVKVSRFQQEYPTNYYQMRRHIVADHAEFLRLQRLQEKRNNG